MNFSLITGATGGLGKEFVKRLAERNENLFLTGRSEEKLILLKEEIIAKNKNITVDYFKCDMVSQTNRNELFNYVKNKNYKITGLYLVAGADTRKAFTKFSQETITFLARVNYESALSFTKFALENKGEELKILVVSSLTGITPMPYFSEYASLKGALISFFAALRYELKNDNVKITLLTPGSIPTRNDIKEDISRQGLQGKLSSKPPKYVVDKALKALDKNKKVCVPGFYNKMVKFFSKITPTSLKMKIVAKKLKNLEKDAFSSK